MDPLKILVVCQHYWPEPFNVHEICVGLVKEGHDVTVLTGLPNYPEGIIPDEYKKKKNRYQEKDDVKIMRAPIVSRGENLKGVNALKRVLNYFSFSISGSRLARKLKGFDVVVAFEFSPILMVIPAIKAAKRESIPLLIYAFDLWPEDLLTGGLSKQGIPYRIMKKYSKKLYGQADAIAITSPDFERYIVDYLGVGHSEFFYLPQYAEESFEKIDPKPYTSDQSEEFNLVFAGNIGGNQALESAIEAMALLKDDSRTHLHIYGGGSRLEYCESLVRKLNLHNKVFLHGRKPLEEMPEVYQAADAMLLTLANPKNGSLVPVYTIPRKLQSYMAAGKPIIAAVDGVAGRIVSEAEAGFTCSGESPSQLAEVIHCMESMSNEELHEMGINSKRYYEDCFSQEKFNSRLNGIWRKLVYGKRSF